ncbi:MAG: flagellar basal body-associated FliL family protein [Endozoicomonas sp.]
MADEQGGQTEPAKESHSGKGLLITLFVVLLLVLVAGVGFAAWNMMAQEEDPDKPAVPHFMEMEPFVITLKSDSRPHYLQIKLSLMSRKPETIKILETYRPMLRNEIIRYLSTLKYESVGKPESPDTIRSAAMGRVNELLVREQVALAIEDLIVTDMVIQ